MTKIDFKDLEVLINRFAYKHSAPETQYLIEQLYGMIHIQQETINNYEERFKNAEVIKKPISEELLH